jgi:hypothetical protein
LGLNYQGFAAVAVEGIQELDRNLNAIASTTASTTPQAQSFAVGFFQNLFSRITAWLADSGNGIADLFAAHVHAQVVDADQVNTKTLCVGQTCVTETQLQQLLNGQGAAAAGSGGTATSTAPILSVNGSNPAQIAVGTTYSDLGASIVGPAADINLGIMAAVDGGQPRSLDQIYIDTSAPGTHTIKYSATDQNGLVGSASREVVVSYPNTATSTPPVVDAGTISSSTPLAANSTPPTTDTGTASSTTATSTQP